MTPAFLSVNEPRSQTGNRLRDLLRFIMRRLDEEQLPQVAGSLTFTSVLALVPIVTIAFAIFTTFPLFTTFRDALEAYFVQSLMPKGVANTVLDNLSLFAAKASRVSAVGAVTLIVTAIMMFAIVDRSLNQIWRVKTPRRFVQRMIVYWAIMTMGPLLIGASLSFTMLLSPFAGSFVRQLPLLGPVLSVLISVGLMTLANCVRADQPRFCVFNYAVSQLSHYLWRDCCGPDFSGVGVFVLVYHAARCGVGCGAAGGQA